MKYWCDNSPVWSHYGNASSVLFPAWERAFAAVVKHYLPVVQDQDLKARMVQFVNEELAHASAHEAFNKRQGLEELEAAEFKRARLVLRKPSLPYWLGTMVSIEHLAACMSRSVIGRWGGRQGRDYKLFLWHAKEELGHKALAIDLWRYLGHSDAELRKIARTNQAYVMGGMIKHTLKETTKDGQLRNWRTWRDLVSWSFFVTTKVLIPMLTIYLPNFHPNKKDDTKYMEVAV
jgi:predicted metal-dependent hydrolase